MNGTPAVVEPHERRGRLGQLHQREGPLLHARAARRADDDGRDALGQGGLEAAGQLLADHAAHAAAHEAEVEDADRDALALDVADAPHRRRRAGRS